MVLPLNSKKLQAIKYKTNGVMTKAINSIPSIGVMSLILHVDPLANIVLLNRPGWRDWIGAMLDGWRTAQSNIPFLILETSVAARTPRLAFATMATGTKRMSAMMPSALPLSSMVRTVSSHTCVHSFDTWQLTCLITHLQCT
ncbi:hypothetical protein XENOCAPTIV_015384 [Xenoophorus captivus]|uniref:NADH:ubiquinone reductase (H(+)-translocating) n=1 Tax=Xenoophorus captivus TaxID=1517983 RepID=A0ABV0R0J8_9TELE